MYTQIVLLTVLAAAQAQITSNGSCNFTSLQLGPIGAGPENLNQSIELYELFRIDNNWQSGQCASWKLMENNSLTVHMTEVVNRQLVERNTTVTPVGNTIFYDLNFNDFSSNFTILGFTSEFLVLYACSNQGEKKNEYIWQLSNSTVLSESAVAGINQTLSNNNFDNLNWKTISHTKEACQTGGTVTLKVSSFIVLFLGLALSKVF